jgi:hypothetical protein
LFSTPEFRLYNSVVVMQKRLAMLESVSPGRTT